MRKHSDGAVPDAGGQTPFTAVVLAGDRGPDDPLVADTGTCCKAMIEIAGTPMVLRVLQALDGAVQVGPRLLCGPQRSQLASQETLTALIRAREIDWRAPAQTPCRSVHSVMQTLGGDTPVLVTTADHPLLSAAIIDEFCRRSRMGGYDVTVGLAPFGLVRQAYPEMKKTVLHFRDGDYCGANLFAFLTSRGRQIADFWRRVEGQRKNPLRIAHALGWGAVVRYLLGVLTLDKALAILSQRLDLRIGAVILPHAEAAVDIDSVADRELVQEKLAG